eukprot:CAMPEP_0177593460 /NCGR_PEP_ID=MMETSP0419_2-20121207/9161_1 /TAXON_ID=582737 /ORGANISM="Tetraselmis sp., Strain GSL018" /LENGTH=233 /DNA_ID=CAMNT_0019084507 /DNA_START=56 /DNA_END=757 /DNA_ORIENTATION=-
MTDKQNLVENRVNELISSGNAAYVDDDFSAAAAAYSSALQISGITAKTAAQIYSLRAQASIRMEDYVKAVYDANLAIQADGSLDKAYLRKGIACFYLEEYETAKSAFLSGLSHTSKPEVFRLWLRKCEAELEEENAESVPSTSASQLHKENESSAKDQATHVAKQQEAEPISSPVSDTTGETCGTQKPAKYRHQWFQSPAAVTLAVMAKGIKAEQADISVQRQSVHIAIKAPR